MFLVDIKYLSKTLKYIIKIIKIYINEFFLFLVKNFI